MYKINYITDFIRLSKNPRNEDFIARLRMIDSELRAKFDFTHPIRINEEKTTDITIDDIEPMLLNAINLFGMNNNNFDLDKY